ncbi:MAG: hypothetical protein H9Q65_02525 [Spiroplasma ixodetis]|nr:hypothetical protein [Spiroplasma ixodetis]MBP1526953.1 hypothetical protein [Spiroplasma ixodetis]MBP1528113.1 hypothetical protein [Spiroplasma ixodetis]
MWRSCNEWSQDRKDAHNKKADEVNKAWGESKEKERREKVANALGFEKDKSKINTETSTSKGQSFSSKSQKM